MNEQQKRRRRRKKKVFFYKKKKDKSNYRRVRSLPTINHPQRFFFIFSALNNKQRQKKKDWKKPLICIHLHTVGHHPSRPLPISGLDINRPRALISAIRGKKTKTNEERSSKKKKKGEAEFFFISAPLAERKEANPSRAIGHGPGAIFFSFFCCSGPIENQKLMARKMPINVIRRDPSFVEFYLAPLGFTSFYCHLLGFT